MLISEMLVVATPTMAEVLTAGFDTVRGRMKPVLGHYPYPTGSIVFYCALYPLAGHAIRRKDHTAVMGASKGLPPIGPSRKLYFDQVF
jgi:hypothetical protein